MVALFFLGLVDHWKAGKIRGEWRFT